MTSDGSYMPSASSTFRAATALESGRHFLGLVEEFASLPARVAIDGKSYFLIRRGENWTLLSSVCPHVGGHVVDVGDVFECPNHGWQFDKRDGKCLNPSTKELSRFPVVEQDGRLFADIPRIQPIERSKRRMHSDDSVVVELRSHATIEVVTNGFSLLMDPWLDGPCFLGSWIHYPPVLGDGGPRRADAIWITHEHSDHFHIPTLERFDRSTPILTPDFPDGRIPARLAELGFTDIRPIPFGEPVELAPDFTITAFEPASLWNDSLLLIEAAGFRMLNLSDAGMNQRIADLVGPVDMISSAFSPSASSYPFAWTHIDKGEKLRLLDRAAQGGVDMLTAAARMYGARYVLPFADHFSLWHPAHREYVRMFPPLTVKDVREALADTEIEVVDLLPGESFDVVRKRSKRLWNDRERIYEPEYVENYLDQLWDAGEFARHYPQGTVTEEEVEDYFLTLNKTPEIIQAEELVVTVRAMDVELRDTQFEVALQLRPGAIERCELQDGPHELLIEIPMGVLAAVVQGDLQWDEAIIGFWCRFSRSPDIYHAGFWRLLHAPYVNRPADLRPRDDNPVSRDTVIGDAVERYGPDLDRIMRRQGMYCVGCQLAPVETIEQGARKHGLDDGAIDRMLIEANAVLGASEPAVDRA